MKLRNLLLLPALWATFSLQAGVFTPATKAMLDLRSNRTERIKDRAETQASFYPLIIAVDSDDTAYDLEQRGVVVFNRRDNMLLACVPESMLAELDIFPGVGRVSAASCMVRHLDKARPFTGVDLVHAGTGLPQGYDGSGVVAAFSDVGFDPAHIAFRNRVEWLSAFKEMSGMRITASTPDRISAWTTDTPNDHHATHVAGILAGGYSANGLQGIATGATIAGTTSQLTDVGILGGVEDIIAFARSKEMPAVINISIGSNNGPHDGSDLFCRYLDLCADEAAICLSAGNFGNNAVSAAHTFTTDGEEYGVVLETSKDWNGMNISGVTDIWSDDSTPLEVQIEVWDVYLKKRLYQSPWTAGNTGTDHMKINDSDGSGFGVPYGGEIVIASELCPLNNRYNIAVAYDIHSTAYDPRGSWSRYFTAIKARGPRGSRASFYADGEYSYFNNPGLPGLNSGNSEQSISNMCCGFNTISVGACNTLNRVTLLDGSVKTWSFELDDPANFSSYGLTIDGRTLPHISAPGNQVVSAMSGPYLAANPEAASILTARATVDGTDYYWYPECGTSMSSPHVAGIFALWLQADPNLKGTDLRRIAIETARHDVGDATNPRWGGGAIDAMAGLRKVIAEAGTEIVEMPALITVECRRIRVEVPGCDNPAVELFNTSGMRLDAGSELTPGIYIVRVTAGRRIISQRIAVKA